MQVTTLLTMCGLQVTTLLTMCGLQMSPTKIIEVSWWLVVLYGVS